MTNESKLGKWLSIAAVSCACLLIASGCGSETETADGESTSAIDEYLGTDFFGDFNSEAAQQSFENQQREAQEIIAACMKREGFEYEQIAIETFNGFAGEDGLEYGSPEWTEKYGFGITTQYFGQSEVGPELLGYDDTGFDEGDEEEFVDPNREYIESLDEAGQEAYYSALYGDEFSESFDDDFSDDTGDDIDGQEIESFEPSGCEGEGYSSESSDFAFFDEFSDELDELGADIESDSKFVAKVDEIQTCVTEAGFELPTGWIIQDIDQIPYQEELDEIEALVGGPDPFVDVDFDSMSEEELDAAFADGAFDRDFTPEAKALLGEVQAEEISTAVATDKCGGGGLEIQNLYQEILADYEDRFIETNKDKLDTYKANREASE